MINYKEDKIIDFLEKLSNTDSMPGGGVAASLVGAVGISAALKVCNLSLGKEKYKEHESLIKESIVKLEEYKNLLLQLMDEDAEKFKAMEEVYKMPKATEEEKAKRKKALEEACKICCEVPIKVITKASSAMLVVVKLVGKTNASAASDLKVGLKLLTTTIYSAWDNIETNLKYIEDEEFKKPLLNIKIQLDDLTKDL